MPTTIIADSMQKIGGGGLYLRTAPLPQHPPETAAEDPATDKTSDTVNQQEVE